MFNRKIIFESKAMYHVVYIIDASLLALREISRKNILNCRLICFIPMFILVKCFPKHSYSQDFKRLITMLLTHFKILL